MSVWPEKLQIHLMDTKGRVIDIFEPGENPKGFAYQFNLQGLPKGIYFLRLVYKNKIENKKIVIH
jgi:hypothetical protein